MSTKRIKWDGELATEAVELLDQGGKIIVSPTKVGYIIMTTDLEGLERKFEVKSRKRNKPGVVLCGSMEQLRELAEMTPEIEKFYQMHWDQDALMGCILPWKESGRKYIPAGAEELMTDVRGTSCFVLRFGTPVSRSSASGGKRAARCRSRARRTRPAAATAVSSTASARRSKTAWT